MTEIGDPRRRAGAGLRAVRGSGRLPRPQLSRRHEFTPGRGAGRRSRPGQGRAPHFAGPPGHGPLDLPAGTPPARLARGRAPAHRIARNRALRRHGLVGRRTLRRRLCGPAGRSGDGSRTALELGAPRRLRNVPRPDSRGPRLPVPEPPHALAGLRHHEGQHHQHQQYAVAPRRDALLPAGRSQRHCRVGTTRAGALLRARVDAPGHRRLHPGLPDLRRPLGIRPRGNPSSRSRSGRVQTTPPDLPGIASSCMPTSPGRPSRWCRARDTSPSSLIRPRRSSTRCSAATRAPTPRRDGTWDRRRSSNAACRAGSARARPT